MWKWIYTISTIILQQHLQLSRLIWNDLVISLERSMQWWGLEGSSTLLNERWERNQQETKWKLVRSVQRGASLHAEQAPKFQQMLSHVGKKVTEPLNCFFCLFCSEDRVIEHYTQIKGLTRGQAIVQWVWHLTSEDDLFTNFILFCWEVAMQALLVIIACQLCLLYLSELWLLSNIFKVFQALDVTDFHLRLYLVLQIPQT